MALHDGRFVAMPGYCQMFARQVVQHCCGGMYDEYWRASAIQTMRAFRYDHRYTVTGPPEAGDLLYKGNMTSGPFGHVGICFDQPGEGLCVAENSSYHMNPEHMGDVDGAKGFRTLAAFGPYEQITRLT